MQNYCKTIGALAAASALVAGNANAEVEYELHTGYSSEYLFRGLDLGDSLVEVGADAAYDWNGLKLSAGVWSAAFDASAPTGNQVDNETDMYTEISKDFGFVTASVGYIYYWNLGSLGEDVQEVPFTISRDFGWANLYLTYFWSVDGPNNNGYTELGGSHAWELSPCLKLNVKSSVTPKTSILSLTRAAALVGSIRCWVWLAGCASAPPDIRSAEEIRLSTAHPG